MDGKQLKNSILQWAMFRLPAGRQAEPQGRTRRHLFKEKNVGLRMLSNVTMDLFTRALRTIFYADISSIAMVLVRNILEGISPSNCIIGRCIFHKMKPLKEKNG